MRPRDLKKGLNLLMNNALASKVYAQEVLKFFLNECTINAICAFDDDEDLYNLFVDCITSDIIKTADKFGLDIHAIFTEEVATDEREDS